LIWVFTIHFTSKLEQHLEILKWEELMIGNWFARRANTWEQCTCMLVRKNRRNSKQASFTSMMSQFRVILLGNNMYMIHFQSTCFPYTINQSINKLTGYTGKVHVHTFTWTQYSSWILHLTSGYFSYAVVCMYICWIYVDLVHIHIFTYIHHQTFVPPSPPT
jgi:hypothetical protein